MRTILRVVFSIISCLIFSAHAKEQVIFVNGIYNTSEHATAGADALASLLSKKGYRVPVMSAHNPMNVRNDLAELYLLKCQEEIYAPQFRRFLAGEDIVVFPKASVLSFYFVGCGKNFDQEDILAEVRKTVQSIIAKVHAFEGTSVLVGHSQGNLLINLAYILYAQEQGRAAANAKMIIVNVANTSLFAIHGHNLTTKSDTAIRFLSILPFEKDAIPRLITGKLERETPACTGNCNFEVASPSLGETAVHVRMKIRDRYSFVNAVGHSFMDTYLSPNVVLKGTFVTLQDRFLAEMYKVLSPTAEVELQREVARRKSSKTLSYSSGTATQHKKDETKNSTAVLGSPEQSGADAMMRKLGQSFENVRDYRTPSTHTKTETPTPKPETTYDIPTFTPNYNNK